MAAAPGAAVRDDTPDYPGKRFGLPIEGPMSVAPMGRRMIALVFDWVICEVVVSTAVGHSIFSGATGPHYYAAQFGTLPVFAVVTYVLTAISGITLGKRLMNIRVIRTNGSRPGFKWAAVRTLLLLCVVPACLTDRDMRGMHDRASDTIVVRM
jgi:uncharacterized RDD family membrane protein YckC